jgi:ribosomal protein L21E
VGSEDCLDSNHRLGGGGGANRRSCIAFEAEVVTFIEEDNMARKSKMQRKVKRVMHEYSTGSLHSGRGGKVVTKRKQAVAIALSMGRKASRSRRSK